MDLLDIIEGKDISVNVISKSGTTTEPALAFRIFKDYLEKSMVRKKQEREFMQQQMQVKVHLDS